MLSWLIMRPRHPLQCLLRQGFESELTWKVWGARGDRLERSKLSGDVVSASRTSYSAFCSSAPLVRTVRERVASLLDPKDPWFQGFEV